MLSLTDCQKMIEARLQDGLIPNGPANLYQPVKYTMENGGKRIRPALALMAANLFSEDVSPALSPALGLEIFHNFTLLHDDLMDNSPLRRNKPTVHEKWDPNTAILSGDAMCILAYRLMLSAPAKTTRHILNTFTDTALKVCEGQQYDMDFENTLDVGEGQYLHMIRLKTAVLLACSLKTGALAVQAPEKETDKLYDLGINLGMAFQLQDDMLDTYGDTKSFGKKIGGDIMAGKKTYLLIHVLKHSGPDDRKQLIKWLENKQCTREEKVTAVKKIFDKYNALEKIKLLIDPYFDTAGELIQSLTVDDARKAQLLGFCEKLKNRGR